MSSPVTSSPIASAAIPSRGTKRANPNEMVAASALKQLAEVCSGYTSTIGQDEMLNAKVRFEKTARALDLLRIDGKKIYAANLGAYRLDMYLAEIVLKQLDQDQLAFIRPSRANGFFTLSCYQNKVCTHKRLVLWMDDSDVIKVMVDDQVFDLANYFERLGVALLDFNTYDPAQAIGVHEEQLARENEEMVKSLCNEIEGRPAFVIDGTRAIASSCLMNSMMPAGAYLFRKSECWKNVYVLSRKRVDLKIEHIELSASADGKLNYKKEKYASLASFIAIKRLGGELTIPGTPHSTELERS